MLDDDDDDDDIDDIYDKEQEYPLDFVDGRLYYGLCALERDTGQWILLNSIRPRTAFQFPFPLVERYLYEYSIMKTTSLKPGIFQLTILTNGMYAVTHKTVWIRLVQRTWRRILVERRQFLRKDYLFQRQLSPNTSFWIPQLQGMLAPSRKTSTPPTRRHF
jgi:hypothetical protein